MRTLKSSSVKLLLMVFITIFLTGCASTATLDVPKHRESFLYVVRDVTFGICANGMCSEVKSKMVGSGFVVARGAQDSFGITAGHLCEDRTPPGMKSVSSFSVRLTGGRSYKASVERVYEKLDICVLRLEGVILPGLRLSRKPPVVGREYFSLSAPRGIHGSRMVLNFSGSYSGRKTLYDSEQDFYTIPATGGSSGSPIMDVKGRIVGMTVMAHRGFEHMAISVPYEAIRDVLYSVNAQALAERYPR